MSVTALQYSLAPMAGYTDLPFRRMCRRFGLHYAHTPLITAGALVYGNPDANQTLYRGDDEPYLAAQLLGSVPADIKKAAAMLSRMHFDAIDFNMGCPVRKVIKTKAGAAMMRYQENALLCLKIIRESTEAPVTVKTRILSENDPEPSVEFCLALQSLGIDAITIHGRLAEKVYSGPVASHIIRAISENLRIPVCANGGVFTAAQALQLANDSACKRIMIARGAIGNPWLFHELVHGQPYLPSHEEVCEIMHEHLDGIRQLYGERKGMILGRKIVQGYLTGRGYRRNLRDQATKISTWGQFREFHSLVLASPPGNNFLNPQITQIAQMNADISSASEIKDQI
ncbi:MAG: tRNA-dihydrouridine synthase family protein [Oligosphaeraceae bacterium]|nr:tRNA-dihydrouridine synthase family protein [Oligosphaeraceae bacterium]